MALKDFDDTNPRTRDKNWKEDISVADLPKMDEWYPFRIVGGVFSYAQHWIEFTNKTGEKKRYPVDCANWDPDNESATKKGNCPACEVGLRPSVRYMMNVIDRTAQQRGESDPIRALDCPPTVMRQMIDLKKLNMVKGEARSIAHPKLGCDIHLQKQRSKKRGGVEWQVQKGDRSPLTEEETALEFISFDEHWMEPDVHKIREDLKRHGYFDAGAGGKSDSDDDTESLPPKKASAKKASRSEDDDEEFETPQAGNGKPAAKKAAARPAVDDDDDDVVPPKAAKKSAVVSDDDDDDSPPAKPKKAVARPAVDDDDDDDDAPPPKPSKTVKKPARPADDDDDFDSDFGDV